MPRHLAESVHILFYGLLLLLLWSGFDGHLFLLDKTTLCEVTFLPASIIKFEYGDKACQACQSGSFCICNTSLHSIILVVSKQILQPFASLSFVLNTN